MKKTKELFAELFDIIRTLRSPSGCPWDRKQTPGDVKAYLVEELYEVFEAIDRDEKKMLVEEIGDLLFMVLFLANIYEEKNAFTLCEAMEGIKRKMIYRHPHVFGSVNVSSAEEVKENWRILKEKEGKKPEKSLLDGIPKNLPALECSFFLSSKAAKAGFDWQTPGEVLEKVKEETEEFEALLPSGPKARMAEEIGDMLFSIGKLKQAYCCRTGTGSAQNQ